MCNIKEGPVVKSARKIQDLKRVKLFSLLKDFLVPP